MKRYPEDFSLLLKDLRLSEGLSQEGFANEIGIPATTVRGWEQTYSLPTAKNWKKLKDKYKDLEIFPALEKAYLSAKRLSRV